MLRREFFGRRNRNKYNIKWRVPTEDGWKKMPIDKVPTAHLLNILSGFNKRGYSKIRGVVNAEDEWMIRYITEVETELDKRPDIEEYL